MMKHRDSLPALPGLLMIVVLLAALNSQLAIAQAPSNGANDQPFFYPAPVAGFNPVTASDADLAALGFPKRPAAADPYYATWVQKMSNAKHRVENPLATATEAVHLPKNRGTNAPTSRLPAGLVANGSTSSDSTVSWSGAEVYYPSNPGYFAQNGSAAYIAFQPPVFGYENCTYAPYHATIWAGLDGDFNPDVLQAGVDVVYNANCTTSYIPFYEWFTPYCTINNPSYPCGQTSVNLTVNPGDAMYIVVTYNTTSPNGSAFISDQTTGYYVSVSFNQPPSSRQGNQYAGSTAEWIVERPGPLNSSSYYNLANYNVPTGPYGYLWMYPDYYTPSNGYVTIAGTDPASNTIFDYMYCTPSYWNPSSACPLVNGVGQFISYLYYQPSNPNGGACIWPGTLCLYPTGPAASQ